MVNPYRTVYRSTPAPWSLERMMLVVLCLSLGLLWVLFRLLPSPPNNPSPLKVRFVTQQPSAPKSIERPRRIVEAPLSQTLPPVEPEYLGEVDHQTAQQTRARPSEISQEDASSQSNDQAADSTPAAQLELVEPAPDEPQRHLTPDVYRQLLPQAADLLARRGGFVEDLDRDDLPEGEAIDVNTTEFRFLGYMTQLRKSVALAFFNPTSRVRSHPEVKQRLQSSGYAELAGNSVVQLTIARSGLLLEARLLESSGDSAVDDFWLHVLQMAAPFAPLPPAYQKDQLLVNYGFRYFLRYDLSRRGAPLLGKQPS